MGRLARTLPGKTTDWAHVRTQLSRHPASLDGVGKILQETNDCNSGVSYSPPPLQSVSEIASNIGSEVGTLAKVDYTLSQQSLLSDQLLCSAERIGMRPDIDVIVALKSEVVNLKLANTAHALENVPVVANLEVARKAYALKDVSQKKSFEANAVFDTGTNVLVTGCTDILHDFEELAEPAVVYGMKNMKVTYTHAGYVIFTLGTTTRRVRAYWDPNETTTVIPGNIWNEDDYYFMGRNRAIHWYKGDQLLGSFPRDLVMGGFSKHPAVFLDYLKHNGSAKVEHSVYPIPDSVFLWKRGKNKVVRTGDGWSVTPKDTKRTLGREIVSTEEQVQGAKGTGYLDVPVTPPPHYVQSPLFRRTPDRSGSSAVETVGDVVPDDTLEGGVAAEAETEKEFPSISDLEIVEWDEEVCTTHHPEPPKPDHPYKPHNKSKEETKGTHNTKGKKGKDHPTQETDLLMECARPARCKARTLQIVSACNMSHTYDRSMSDFEIPASGRSKTCYAFQDGECNRGEGCRFSHEGPAGKGGNGKGGKAGKGGKGGKGKGGKGSQTPVDLGERSSLSELKAPSSMDVAGTHVYFAVTDNGADVHQGFVKKYESDAHKSGNTHGGGCHVHLILCHEAKIMWWCTTTAIV